MAFAFDAGEDFAFDKSALRACPNLAGLRCRIHDSLAMSGFRGCVSYECLGAGQRLITEVFPGANWYRNPELRAPLARALPKLHRIHEALELLVAAEHLPLSPDILDERAALVALFHPQSDWTPESLDAYDLGAARQRLGEFLTRLRDHL